MKHCTNLDQSIELAKILTIDTADMCWREFEFSGINDRVVVDKQVVADKYDPECDYDFCPAWSLGALMGIINEHTESLMIFYLNVSGVWEMQCRYKDKIYYKQDSTQIGVCVEIIKELDKDNLL